MLTENDLFKIYMHKGDEELLLKELQLLLESRFKGSIMYFHEKSPKLAQLYAAIKGNSFCT